MYKYIIDTGFPCLVIANKADKIAPSKVDGATSKLQESLNPLKDLTFLSFSSEKKVYTKTVWEFIDKYLNF